MAQRRLHLRSLLRTMTAKPILSPTENLELVLPVNHPQKMAKIPPTPLGKSPLLLHLPEKSSQPM